MDQRSDPTWICKVLVCVSRSGIQIPGSHIERAPCLSPVVQKVRRPARLHTNPALKLAVGRRLEATYRPPFHPQVVEHPVQALKLSDALSAAKLKECGGLRSTVRRTSPHRASSHDACQACPRRAAKSGRSIKGRSVPPRPALPATS